MLLKQLYILAFLNIIPLAIFSQQASEWGLGTGSDLCVFDANPLSLYILEEEFVANSEIVFCPAGFERSSANDVKKRQRFSWKAKYDNIYLRNKDGVVYEGMNRHGFSASLMFVDDVHLPEKEKELIPIGASLVVNFFIDHFKCVDTALLAVWDIRVFDDMNLDQGWPFRIVLHDTSGASAYIEYQANGRSVFTPDYPSFIISGTSYERMLKMRHIPGTFPENKVETLYLDIVGSGFPTNTALILLKSYMVNFSRQRYFGFFRYHAEKELFILTPSNDEAVFNFNEIDFVPGEEVTTRFF
jgi:hypothetical protein